MINDPASPGGPRHVRLDIAYRGSPFHGFAENPDVPSVEGCLKRAMRRILRHDVGLVVAGRTDRGVHATGQVVSLDTTARHFDAEKLRDALNKMCSPDIVVLDVTEVGADFHARFSAKGRRYVYRVLVSDLADPMRAELVWWIRPPISVERLNITCAVLNGSHDFSGFCRQPKGQPEASMIRRVFATAWSEVGDELRFEIEANAFCTQMVRSIVGAAVDIGRGRSPDDLMAVLLETGDRALAPELAPPQGLTLTEVTY